MMNDRPQAMAKNTNTGKYELTTDSINHCAKGVVALLIANRNRREKCFLQCESPCA
jgi:hypothetical protein